MQIRVHYIFVLFWLAIVPSFTLAADTVDSLKNELSQHPERDQTRVDILNQLAYQFWIIDPVESESYSGEALDIAISLEYQEGAAFANRSLGVSHWARGNYEEGLTHLVDARQAYHSLGDTVNIANVLLNIGLIYAEQGSYSEAFENYDEAQSTFAALGRPERYINTVNHLGELMEKQGHLDRSYGYYKEALELSDSLEYTYGQATANMNIGSFYRERGSLDSALFFCNKALQLQERNDDLHGQAKTLFTTGTIFILKKNYTAAQQRLKEGLNRAVRFSSKKLRRDIYLKLNEAYKLQGNFNKALEYLEKYSVLHDSLLNAEMLKNMGRLENKVALEQQQLRLNQQQHELEILHQKARIDTVLRAALITGILLIIIFGYLLYSRQKLKIEKDRAVYQSNQALAEVELENSKLKARELQQKIEFKNKELTSYTLNFLQKNELMSEMKSTIDDLKRSQDPEVVKMSNSLNRLISNSSHIDKEWEDFKRYFEEVHTEFFSLLKSKYPDITTSELKLSALLKLNMNLKEAANILGISPESVKTARYRLRKKLGLNKEENLVDFIINLERELVA